MSKIVIPAILLLKLCVLSGCHRKDAATDVMIPMESMRDYVSVGKLMDSVRAPYVIDVSSHSRRVVFVGCDHNRDPLHPQFDTIRQYFGSLRPQVALNEGGQIHDSFHYATIEAAARKGGETAVLKFLSDQSGIKLLDGDLTDSVEFAIMTKRFPKGKLFLYYIMERVVIPYLSGAYGDISFPELYDKAVMNWFVKPGFPLNQDERDLPYFTGLFRKYVGHEFRPERSMDIELFDYINPDCEFCELGRASKVTRDSMLLVKINHALQTNDRVIVTFGHGHALAIEPALRQMMHDYE